jgi:tetratricopeptide (TPR) repeat protein
MNSRSSAAALARLGWEEKLEDPSSRYGLPHLPEFDLKSFSMLYRQELQEARSVLKDRGEDRLSAEECLVMGRISRCLGDRAGAARFLRRARAKRPGWGAPDVWLAELELSEKRSLARARRACETAGDYPPAFLVAAQAESLHGGAGAALAYLQRYVELKPGTAIGRIMLGAAALRLRRKELARQAFEEAAGLEPVCSAALLLRARAARIHSEACDWLARAYDVSPVFGFVTLQIHRRLDIRSRSYVRRMLRVSFEHPELIARYYQREATQTHYSNFPAEDYRFVRQLAGLHRLPAESSRGRGRLRAAARQRPGAAWVYAFLGRAACYTPSGLREGLAHLNRAAALAPHAGWIRAWRANARKLLGDADGAAQDFDRAMSLQPFYHRAFCWRGALFRKSGRLEDALSDLDRAAVMDPHYSMTFFERFRVLRLKGDYASAARDLDAAFLLDQRYHWAFKTGGPPSPAEMDAGLREMTAGLKKRPRCASLLAWRGDLHAARGDAAEAVRDFDSALRADSARPLVRSLYGRCLLKTGDLQRAASVLRLAVKEQPDLLAARGWLAEAEFGAGRAAAAIGMIDAVLARHPGTAWAHQLKAEFLARQGKLRPSLRSSEAALRLDGKYPEAYLLLSSVRLELGDSSGARDAAQRCVDVAPNLGRAYVARAQAAFARGRFAEAVADYRRVVRDHPYLFNEQEMGRIRGLLGGA